MNRWNPCCCQKEKECAYLFLKRKILGLDPIFGSPGINIWGQTFKGYTGPLSPGYSGTDAITGCGRELAEGIYEHMGISYGYEMWTTPKLLAHIPEDNISWGGSPDMQKKNFTYFISGNFVLPRKYQGLSFGSFENAIYKDEQLHYRYFGGNDDILTSIQNCLSIRRQDLFTARIPYVEPGTICDIGKQIGGITSEIRYDDVTYGITSGSESNEISNEHIFDIKITYSNDLNEIIRNNNNRIFYSVIEPKEPVGGEITPLCKIGRGPGFNAWCKGVTLNNNCYVPPYNVGDKKVKLAFYQTIPEALDVYRVDLHKCTDETTGENYLSIGNVYFEQSFRIQPVLPASEKTTKCSQDVCLPRGVDASVNRDPVICGGYRYYPNDYEYCEPIEYTKKGLKWNFNCKEFTCSQPDNPDCADWEEYERSQGSPDCSDILSDTTISVTIPWENYRSVVPECPVDCGDPNNARRIVTTTYEGRFVNREARIPEDCGYRTEEPTGCLGAGTSTRSIECETLSYEKPVCNPPEPISGPDFNLFCLNDDCTSYFLRWTLKNTSTVTRTYCDGTTEKETYTSDVYAQASGRSYNCKESVRRICESNPGIPLGPSFCTCCCGVNCDGETEIPTVTVATLQEATQYEINPYIMIDGNPAYFDGPEYTLPNFNNYIKNYFDIWKSDRQELDSSVDNYEIFVDNPTCNVGFLSDPGRFFFLNKQKGITAGTFKQEYCEATNKFYTVPIWKTVPNPDYPCENVYTFSSNKNINCFNVVKNKNFDTISKEYSKLPPEQQPPCFKEIIKYFPTEQKEVDGITFISLVGITLQDCNDFRSVSQVNKILKL